MGKLRKMPLRNVPWSHLVLVLLVYCWFSTNTACIRVAPRNDLSSPLPKGTVEDIVKTCNPLSDEEKIFLKDEIKHYEKSTKFQNKIAETRGEKPMGATHVAIVKYLKDNVFKRGQSILDMGAASGAMLRYTIDAFIESEDLKGLSGRFQGVELVTGWATFAKEYFSDTEKFGDHHVSFSEGDITDFTLDDPTETFDLILLNDVMEHLQRERYGCFFQKLQSVTHNGSIVYMHTPTPEAQLLDQGQYYENILPHHIVIAGMAMSGFQLLSFEHDMDTRCSPAPSDLPKMIDGGHCYQGGWPKYYHALFVRTGNTHVFELK